MENKIKDISARLLKEIDKEKNKLLDMDAKNKYEASVILSYLSELDRQSILLNMLMEESEDEEYIMDNKHDIKEFFKSVKDFCSKIPAYE